MTTIEKVCSFVGVFLLMGASMLNESVSASFIFIYLLVTVFFLTAGRCWKFFEK